MKPRSAKLLEDIRDAAGFIRDCVRGKTLAEYRTERMLRQAVTRVPVLLKDVESLLEARG